MGNLSEKQWDELITEYEEGGTTVSLAKKFKINRSTLRVELKKRNIKFHPPGFFYTKRTEDSTNVHTFDEITPESAYFLGLLFADGCVSDTNSVELGLKSTDRGHIAKFKDFMQSNNAIEDRNHKIDGKVHYSSRFRVRNAYLARTLASYGIGPRKSLTAEAREDLVSNRHFWRGECDGDGSVMLFTRKREITPTVGFALVGSEKMMHQFAEFAEPIIGKRMNVCKPASIYRVSCEGLFAYKIIKHLYEDAEVFLDRKMEKAKKIIEYYEKKIAIA